jgi:hypothetical protein
MGERVPVHEPDAVHELAFVQAYVSVLDCPSVMVVGFAETVAVGAAVTVTVAGADLVVPPAPVHEAV